jgi:iron complex transport system substrate-binding protein
MTTITRRSLGLAASAGTLGLLATACSGPADTDDAVSGGSDGGGKAGSVTIEDNNGTHEVPKPPKSVVATDNNSFQTLSDWGIQLTAAARALMPSTIPEKDDDDIVDLGLHIEPDLEAVVEVEPDLIITGSRFSQYNEDFEKLAPDAAIVTLDVREDKPFDEELKRRVDTLAEIFDKQDEAKKLDDDLDAAVARVKDAYQSGDKVMSVIVSGGEIGYSAPHVGRTFGPLYDLFDFTPALEVEGADDDHQGDDVSVETIADSNPDWILVMDRDAALSEEDSQPAAEVIEKSEALKKVTAITEGNVVYMPEDTYTNEGMETYTKYFGTLADAFEKQN